MYGVMATSRARMIDRLPDFCFCLIHFSLLSAMTMVLIKHIKLGDIHGQDLSWFNKIWLDANFNVLSTISMSCITWNVADSDSFAKFAMAISDNRMSDFAFIVSIKRFIHINSELSSYAYPFIIKNLSRSTLVISTVLPCKNSNLELGNLNYSSIYTLINQ